MTRILPTAGLLLLLAAPLRAQCPDGTPPPCTAPRRVAAAPAPPALSVAVLNFENRSRDTADAYLAEGLADEIASRLGQVGRLTVTSRAMVRRLRDPDATPLPDLGRALNASYLVTGSLQSSSRQLRVSVELLRATSGAQAWTSTYDRTRDDLLAIQADVATAVAVAIAGRLLPQERATLASRPTANPDAYEHFLRGRVLYQRGSTSDLILGAVAQFQQAVALDSSFAAAWAALSLAQAFAYWIYIDRSQARLDAASAAAERAMRLAPNLPDSRIAAGYIAYWGRRDYATARREFEAALQADSSRADAYQALANIERRQGQWDSSLRHRGRSLAIDPSDFTETVNMAETLLLLRRYDSAEVWVQRAEALGPGSPEALLDRAFLGLATAGDTARARSLLTRAVAAGPGALYVDLFATRALTSNAHLVGALDTLVAPSTPTERTWYLLLQGRRLAARGDTVASRASFDSLRGGLEAAVLERPDDEGFYERLALAYAYLGRGPDARRAIDRAVQLLPVTRDALGGEQILITRAEVLVLIGDHDAAVAQLRALLAIPSLVSVPWLRVWDRAAPLRGRPDFEQLLAGH